MNERIDAKKSLGQHFLHDAATLRNIAALCVPQTGSGIVEVGPGTGNLTAHLLALGAPLVTIERDRRMLAVLGERFGADLPVLEGDAAQFDWSALLSRPALGPHPVVAGNLPYYAAMPILFAVLEARPRPARIVIMVQREVANRLLGKPSTPDQGQISIKVQRIANVRMGLRVGRGAFSPPPNVESAVVVIEPLAVPHEAVPDDQRFSALVTAGFAQRRKTLTNSLHSSLGILAAQSCQALDQLGIDVRVRGEALSVAQWAALARLLDADVAAALAARGQAAHPRHGDLLDGPRSRP